jgi:threonyl-tRNA synthetase
VSVRTRSGEDRRGVPLEEFIASAKDAIASRAIDAD